jgi:mannose-1-phosphate guanylyltransferase
MAHLALATRAHASVADRLWGVVLTGRRAAGRFRMLLPRRRSAAAARVTRDRASEIVAAERLVTVLARGDADAAGASVLGQRVVQPAYRGSAAEAFLPLSMIVRRDPSAIVVLLPADGVGQDEPEFPAAVRRGAEAVALRPDVVLLLGLAPPCARPPGWIEPGDTIAGLERFAARRVRRFVRRPGFGEAAALQARGALVSTGVIVAQAETLLGLGRRRLPDVLETLEPLEAAFGKPEASLLCEAIYEAMPYADLSHALGTADEPVGVLAVPRTRARLKPVASA